MACGDKIMALQEESSAYLSSGNLDYNFTRMKAPKGIKNSKDSNWLRLEKVNFRNIENESFSIPKERMIVCCGVSGAGKSSLIRGYYFQVLKKPLFPKRKP